MSATKIESVRIKGFRSLADVELSGLGGATVLIGANGSGKSNFIRFFEMMRWMLRSRRLGEFVGRHGGADDQLHGGTRVTARMEAEIALRADTGRNDYRFALTHTRPDRLVFTEEAFRFSTKGCPTDAAWQHLGSGHREAAIVEAAHARGYHDDLSPHLRDANQKAARVIVSLVRSCAVHQFHDTSDTSRFKILWDVTDNNSLHTDGANLAAILLRLEREDVRRFEFVCRQIQQVLPIFDRFDLEERYGKVALRWKARGYEKTFGAHLTSDGSLRLFALVTLLNLPPEMLPDVLLLDEPELDLHPAAITLIGEMIKALAEERQVIVATQSPLLVDAFDLDEFFVLEAPDGQTKVHRLEPDRYRAWLEDDFTPGDLWLKNLLGGRP